MNWILFCVVSLPTKIVHPTNKKIVKTACGAEFSMFIDENNLLYSFGRPEHGQLGHNTDGQYFVTSNKLAFDCEVLPRHVAVFVEKTKDGFTHIIDDVKVVDVACGNNHTVQHYCYFRDFLLSKAWNVKKKHLFEGPNCFCLTFIRQKSWKWLIN